jgi:hypothetical protein
VYVVTDTLARTGKGTILKREIKKQYLERNK